MGDTPVPKLRRGPSAPTGTGHTGGVRDPWIVDVRRRLDHVERELWWIRLNIALLTALGVTLLVWVLALGFHW